MTYNTEKKNEVLRFFSDNRARAFSLQEVCEALLPDGKGKSTVYRIVAMLVEAGTVRKISDARTRHCVYQFIGDGHCSEHLHLKCLGCGKLIHLDEATTGKLRRSLKESNDFELDEEALLFGSCAECKAARKTR